MRFILPFDLQLEIHDAGSFDFGLEHTPAGAGPMFSSVLYTSWIFIACVFNTSVLVKLILCGTTHPDQLVYVHKFKDKFKHRFKHWLGKLGRC